MGQPIGGGLLVRLAPLARFRSVRRLTMSAISMLDGIHMTTAGACPAGLVCKKYADTVMVDHGNGTCDLSAKCNRGIARKMRFLTLEVLMIPRKVLFGVVSWKFWNSIVNRKGNLRSMP
jgi:hypothetical protein